MWPCSLPPLQVKYKEDYERSRGKLIGANGAQGDSQMSHSLQMSKLQSELEYKKGFEDTKSQCHVSMDMVHLVHARKAQHLATDIGYKTASHHFTALPTDMKVEWAKKAYDLQSDVRSVCVHVCVCYCWCKGFPRPSQTIVYTYGIPISGSLNGNILTSQWFNSYSNQAHYKFYMTKQKIISYFFLLGIPLSIFFCFFYSFRCQMWGGGFICDILNCGLL